MTLESEDPRYLKAVYISYAFGNYQAFWQFTKHVIEYYTLDDLCSEVDGFNPDCLPSQLLSKPNPRRTWRCADVRRIYGPRTFRQCAANPETG